MDNNQEKNTNINDILKLLNRVNETFVYEIYIPSLQKNVMFRQINTSQQKRLIKAIIDSPAYNTEFIFTLKQIIDENCAEKIDVNNLTILDKLIIAIKMRANSIGHDFELTFEITDPETKESKKITKNIDLNTLLENKLEAITVSPTTLTDDKNIYSITCSLPTIYEEYKLEDEVRKSTSTVQIKDEKELRNVIGEVFVGELVKYIKTLVIKDGDKLIELDLKNVDFKNRLKIIDQLPTGLTKQVIDYIGNVQKEFDKIILIKDNIDGKDVEQRLKIDASFFTRS